MPRTPASLLVLRDARHSPTTATPADNATEATRLTPRTSRLAPDDSRDIAIARKSYYMQRLDNVKPESNNLYQWI